MKHIKIKVMKRRRRSAELMGGDLLLITPLSAVEIPMVRPHDLVISFVFKSGVGFHFSLSFLLSFTQTLLCVAVLLALAVEKKLGLVS